MDPKLDLGKDLQVESLLGTGTTAQAYRAWDALSKGPVAVKRLRPDLASDPVCRERFDQESQSRFHHPNIVSVVRSALGPDGIPYVVMELLDGGSLAGWLAEKGTLPWEIAAVSAIAVLSALEEIHQQGYIHRDLKPGNILLTRSGVPKIDEAGIARPVDVPGNTTAATDPDAIRHLPPEAFNAGTAGVAWNIHAMGTILYELVKGRPTFTENTVAPLIGKILSTERPVSKVWPDFDQVVKKAMAPAPAARYESAAAMARALKDCVEAVNLGENLELITEYRDAPSGDVWVAQLRQRQRDWIVERARAAAQRDNTLERFRYLDLLLALDPDHPAIEELASGAHAPAPEVPPEQTPIQQPQERATLRMKWMPAPESAERLASRPGGRVDSLPPVPAPPIVVPPAPPNRASELRARVPLHALGLYLVLIVLIATDPLHGALRIHLPATLLVLFTLFDRNPTPAHRARRMGAVLGHCAGLMVDCGHIASALEAIFVRVMPLSVASLVAILTILTPWYILCLVALDLYRNGSNWKDIRILKWATGVALVELATGPLISRLALMTRMTSAGSR